MNLGLSRCASALVTRSSTANKEKEKPKTNKKMYISEDVEIHPIQDHFNGERYVGNMRWKILQEKKSLQQEWIAGDGVAATHYLRRPSYKLKSIDKAGRSSREQQEWQEVQNKCAKDARVRAIQMHFQLIARIATALPIAHPRSATYPARRVKTSVALPALISADEYNRSWIYDTGAGRSCIGRKHLTESEKKRVYQCEKLTLITAAGTTSTSTAVDCYVPYLGNRRCYVMGDCPLRFP
jgi:hypothetical protein